MWKKYCTAWLTAIDDIKLHISLHCWTSKAARAHERTHTHTRARAEHVILVRFPAKIIARTPQRNVKRTLPVVSIVLCSGCLFFLISVHKLWGNYHTVWHMISFLHVTAIKRFSFSVLQYFADEGILKLISDCSIMQNFPDALLG